MEKLLFSLLLIVSGLVVGYGCQKLLEYNIIRSPLSVAALRKLLQKAGLLFFMPISVMAAVWIVSFETLAVALLPFFGGATLIFGGVVGFGVAKLFNSSPRETGVYICSSSFTNIGCIGGLVCYVLLGEVGFALVTLYKMFEELIYYTIGFPLARYYSGAAEGGTGWVSRCWRVISDPFFLSAIIALSVGLFLNITNVERPLVFETITSIFVPVGTFALLVSIGLGMKLSSIREHLPMSCLIAGLKVTLIPLTAVTVAYFLGFGDIDGGLPLKVILIAASMPVAFNSLVAASLYDLDLDLANAIWLVSTASLLLVLPLLFVLTHIM